MKAEFPEGRECRDSVWGTQQGKEGGSSLLGARGFLLMIVVWCRSLLRHPGTGQSKDEDPGVVPWSQGGLGASGLEYSPMLSSPFWPGPSLDVISSKEIVHCLSLTRRTCAVCIWRHVYCGGPQQQEEEQKANF